MADVFNKNTPAINPTNNDELVGVLKNAMFKTLQEVDGVLPAKVIAYNRDSNTVQAQILINIVGTSGQQYPNKQIPIIPVLQMGGGGFMVNFPLQPGDLGYVVAMDRNISNFLSSLKEAAPPVYNIKDFTSSVFIPSIIRGYDIDSEDSSSLVIQSLDGSVKISLSNDTIKIKAPNVEIDGGLTVNGSLNVNGNNNTVGNMYVDGNIAASGSITADVPPS